MLSTVLHLFPHSTFMSADQHLEFISRACLSIILTTVIKTTIDESTVASKLSREDLSHHESPSRTNEVEET